MKFVVSSSKLYGHLDLLRSVTGRSKTFPILNCVQFLLDGNTLTMKATDLETTLSLTESVVGEASGDFVIQSGILIDTIRYISDQPLTFSVKKEGKMLEISSSYGKYQLAIFNSEDYPKLEPFQPESQIELGIKGLLRGVGMTVKSVSTDDLKPVMCGVLFKVDQGQLFLVGTDANKLALYQESLSQQVSFQEIIIPVKPLIILKNYLSDQEEESKVTLGFSENNVNFSFKNFSLTARLIDGKYPNYEAIIPKESPNVLKVDRSELIGSLKRVVNFSDQQSFFAKLGCKGKQLKIMAENVAFSNSAQESLQADYQGDDLEICFNARHLLSLLENVDGRQIVMSFSLPIKPALIKVDDEEASSQERDYDLLMLLAPIGK